MGGASWPSALIRHTLIFYTWDFPTRSGWGLSGGLHIPVETLPEPLSLSFFHEPLGSQTPHLEGTNLDQAEVLAYT